MTDFPRRRSIFRARTATAFSVLVAVLLAMAVTGCRDSNPNSPSGTFRQTFTGHVIGFGVDQHALTATRAGEMRGVLTWTDGNTDLDLYLTGSECNVYPLGGGCTVLDISDALAGTSETVTLTVASGDQFKFFVDSFAVSGQDYTLVVTIE